MELKKSTAKYWILLGVVFILSDPILAYLSNKNLIHWVSGLERVASVIIVSSGITFLIVGIVKVLKSKL